MNLLYSCDVNDADADVADDVVVVVAVGDGGGGGHDDWQQSLSILLWKKGDSDVKGQQ